MKVIGMACMTSEEGRRQVIASAIASQRIEGLELAPEDTADLDRYVTGEISLAELRTRIEARYMGR